MSRVGMLGLLALLLPFSVGARPGLESAGGYAPKGLERRPAPQVRLAAAPAVEGAEVRFTVSGGSAVGFFLYRWDPAAGDFSPVQGEMIMARLDGATGATYRVVDESVPGGGSAAYVVVAVDERGREDVLGPFAVEIEPDDEVKSFPLSGAAKEMRGPGAADSDEEDSDSDDDSDAERWERRAAAARGAAPVHGPRGWADARVRIEVAERGLHRLGADELAAVLETRAPFVRQVLRRRAVRLSSLGQDVAYHVDKRGESLVFFATLPESPYASTGVYWLELGSGRAIGTVDGQSPAAGAPTVSAATRRYESDAVAVTVLPAGSDDDFFYWGHLAAGHPTYGTTTLEFELEPEALLSGPAAIDLELQGVTSTWANPDHRAEVAVNGVPVGGFSWDGAELHVGRLEFSGDLLLSGSNEIEVTAVRLPGVYYSVFLVDGFDLTYERVHLATADRLELEPEPRTVTTVGGFSHGEVIVLDVTDTGSPSLVTGTTEAAGTVSFVAADGQRRYAVAGSAALVAPRSMARRPALQLAGEAEGAEYVVVAPRAFAAAAAELAALRAESGLTTTVVELETVFDEFGHGLPTPWAVRDLLAHAAASWKVAPRFVALVGAASYDYRDIQGLGGNVLPTFMARTPYGLYGSDAPFADLVGDDAVPELAVGRIPAASADQLQAYVDKLRSSERFAAGVEPDDVLMLADNADRAGNFPYDSDVLITRLPTFTTAQRIYLSHLPAAQARARLGQELADGAAWVNYIGHGSIDRFAAESLLTVADVEAMPVAGRMPVVSALTCTSGRFEMPGFTSLAEALVLAPGGGAVAVFSASGQSLHFEAMVINRALFDAVWTDGVATAGEAVMAALAEHGEVGHFEFSRRIFNLLGDPAARLR